MEKPVIDPLVRAARLKWTQGGRQGRVDHSPKEQGGKKWTWSGHTELLSGVVGECRERINVFSESIRYIVLCRLVFSTVCLLDFPHSTL